MPKVWGTECDFLTKQLFRLLSLDCKIGRISLQDFIERFFLPLHQGDNRMRQIFVFRLLDCDQDGFIRANDLAVIQEQINMDSKFG